MTGLDTPHPYPGKRIIIEGDDGSGKSTQIPLLHHWPLAERRKVPFAERNSSARGEPSLVRQRQATRTRRAVRGRRR